MNLDPCLVSMKSCQLHCFQNFAGVCGALMIGVGAVGSVLAGLYVDRTKRFEEVVKVCWALAVLFGIGFTQVWGRKSE